MKDNIPMVKVKKYKKPYINQEVEKLRKRRLTKWKRFGVTQDINDEKII